MELIKSEKYIIVSVLLIVSFVLGFTAREIKGQMDEAVEFDDKEEVALRFHTDEVEGIDMSNLSYDVSYDYFEGYAGQKSFRGNSNVANIVYDGGIIIPNKNKLKYPSILVKLKNRKKLIASFIIAIIYPEDRSCYLDVYTSLKSDMHNGSIKVTMKHYYDFDKEELSEQIKIDMNKCPVVYFGYY